ncbi:hypothetical protein ACHFCA_27260 [Delftia tsuruhatensis]
MVYPLGDGSLYYGAPEAKPFEVEVAAFFNQSDMPIIPVHFDESDTTPERLEARARELDISVEALIQRAIAEHLGAYGLPVVSTSPEPENLSELFQAHGLLKQQQK